MIRRIPQVAGVNQAIVLLSSSGLVNVGVGHAGIFGFKEEGEVYVMRVSVGQGSKMSSDRDEAPYIEE
jgi:hypothetical protein